MRKLPDQSAWIERRIECAVTYMPLIDAMPREVRQALADMQTCPTWAFIEQVSAWCPRLKPATIVSRIQDRDAAALHLKRQLEIEWAIGAEAHYQALDQRNNQFLQELGL